MKNKKGFTLIEVLAVIIILAIILVIIAPKINEYYKDSVKRKNLQSAYGVRNALNQYYASYTGTFRGYTCEFPDNCSEIKLDGTVPTSGVVSITADGIISGFVRYDNNVFTLDDEGVTASEYTTVPGDFFDFSYSTSGEQTFLVTDSGYYKLEVWGAQGGSAGSTYIGGYGGYSSGIVYLTTADELFINVGGKGSDSTAQIIKTNSGGYNGGGNGYVHRNSSGTSASGGGGATHIALSTGTLASFDANNNGSVDTGEIDDLLIVAGGGGGTHTDTDGNGYASLGGHGGGAAGSNARQFGSCNNNCTAYSNPSGGTQSSGGLGVTSWQDGTTSSSSYVGKFGLGATGTNSYGGGGGGFYGGASGNYNGGGGGSGYIGNSRVSNGVMYCYGCAEDNNDGTRTISTTGSNKDAACPNGYSSNPLSNCAKSENGYARITYIGSSL